MTETELKDFIKSAGWIAVCDELKERRQYVINLLIKGEDLKWTDDNMRGRISEIEYVETLPDAMLREIELDKVDLQKNVSSNNKEPDNDYELG